MSSTPTLSISSRSATIDINSGWLAAAVFAVAAYAQVFLLPLVAPVPVGDEVLWLVDGVRINHGQVLYRDFYEVTFPGVQYFYAVAQRMFGASAWIPAATYILLGAITAGLMFSIARRVLPGYLPWLVVGLYLVGPFYLIPDATHHWFAALFAYTALWFVLRSDKLGSLALAGASCAAATFFMQTKGAFVLGALIIYVIWRGRRHGAQIAAMTVTFVVTLSVLLAPAILAVGYRDFVYNTFGYVLSGWGSEFFDTWRVYMAFPPPHASLLDAPRVFAFLLVYAVVPAVYVLFFARWVGRRRITTSSQPSEELIAIAAVGLALFLAVAKAPSTIRLASGSAPAMILLLYLLAAPYRIERAVLRATWATVTVLLVACPVVRQLQCKGIVETRIGRVAVYDAQWRDTVAILMQRLSPGQPCFGNHAACYLAGDVVVGPVNFIFPSDYTTLSQVQQIIQDLDRHRVPRLVLRAIFYLPVERGAHDHLGPFRSYLGEHYRFEQMLPNTDEIWVRVK